MTPDGVSEALGRWERLAAEDGYLLGLGEGEAEDLRCILSAAKEWAHALRVKAQLVEALEHMRWCRPCSEDSWSECEGGRQAEAALKAAKETP